MVYRGMFTQIFRAYIEDLDLDPETSMGPVVGIITLPETNMAPENRYLEKEIPIGNHHLKVPC